MASASSSSWLSVLRKPAYRLGLILTIPVTLTIAALATGLSGLLLPTEAIAQSRPVTDNRPLTLRADVQEANAKTGVVNARGNVQINYPARQIQATAAQAQYYSRERRIVLSGDVYVLQEGNSLRGERVTYLIDEGKFIALPDSNKQVESTYIVTETNPPAAASTPPPVVPPSNVVPNLQVPIILPGNGNR